MLHIYDAMAVLRRALDNDPFGKGPRKVIMQMLCASPKDVHCWVFEGKGSKKERRKIYPGYKERPSTMTDGFFKLVAVIREALSHTPAMQIHVDGFEADDVIAALVQTYAGQMPIQVHTVDRDLHQLGVYPQTKINAPPFKKPIKNEKGAVIGYKDDIADKHVRLYKTYVGDPSDKIPGLVGFGSKGWQALDPEKLMVANANLVRNRPDPVEFIAAGMPEATARRLCERPQAELLRRFWIIVGFLPLGEGWQDEIKVGVLDKTKAELILAEHRQ